MLHVGRGVARLFFMKMYNYIQFLVSLFQICNSFDQKGGHTVSIRDYSPDFHVDLHTVCYLMWQKKKGLKGEEVISTQDTTSYNLQQ